EIEAKIRTLQGVQNLYSSIGEGSLAGVNDAQIFVQLKDLKERDFSMFDSMTAARKILSEYPRLRPAVQASGGISGAKNYDTQMYIRGPDFKQINTWVADIMTRMRQNPLFANVDSSFIEGKPEVQVVFDRERAHRLGVRMEQVAAGLRTLVGGKDQITRFKEGEELYEVRVRLRPEDRVNPEAIAGLLFPTTNGTMVRLDAVASIRTGAGPAQIDRQDRQRAITVYANLAPKAGLGDANDFLLKCAKAQNMPSAYTSGFTGRGREMERTKRGFGIAFLLSAIFMYMILASQFESFLHPVTIMLSLPLSVPFAILSLLLTDSSLNVFSGLGVFMLFGIVKKNAILQIDYTNTLREKGLNRDQAVVEANHARLRPILMTTITLVIGMLPMALGTGPGAAVRATLATVIVGGQSLCLLITLLLTPVAYTLFDDVVVWLQQHMPRLER
ncbi:MAG TPA: efflux RND transporter permease subunit, partial [Candidatus Ozemobacteraceae bacterium]|nr:efflux RND transporter permease subunit [Candidatus Ozemobacteraceae bacterium]